MATKKTTNNENKKRNEIKNDLLAQLSKNGVTGTHFTDLVDDYMSLWNIKNELIKDIKERGVVTEYNNGGGQSGTKRNDSVTDLIKVNAQMSKLLQSLNLTTDSAIPKNGDEEDYM